MALTFLIAIDYLHSFHHLLPKQKITFSNLFPSTETSSMTGIVIYIALISGIFKDVMQLFF